MNARQVIAYGRPGDEIVVTPAEHIPRIQEAQATAYHLLREMAVNDYALGTPRAC